MDAQEIEKILSACVKEALRAKSDAEIRSMTETWLLKTHPRIEVMRKALKMIPRECGDEDRRDVIACARRAADACIRGLPFPRER